MTRKVRNPLIILMSCAFLGACGQAEFSELSLEEQIALGLLGALIIHKATHDHGGSSPPVEEL